jgi:hypothetical protein
MRVSIRPAILILLINGCVPTWAQEVLRNWFNDPFVRLTADDASCPTPAGPYVNEKERLAQSHRRAEKGTTAWLAGEADRPKAYAYDADIATALTEQFRGKRFPGSSVWATVQGRVVYLEGCVAKEAEVSELDQVARGVQFVQQVVVIVRSNSRPQVPYRVMPPTSAQTR